MEKVREKAFILQLEKRKRIKNKGKVMCNIGSLFIGRQIEREKKESLKLFEWSKKRERERAKLFEHWFAFGKYLSLLKLTPPHFWSLKSKYQNKLPVYCYENFEIIAYCNEDIIAITWYELFLNLLQWHKY